jgi:head-tail adaptor
MPGHVPSGMLRIPMTAQNPVRTVDAFGQASEAWVNVAVLHCHIEVASNNETMGDLGPEVRTDWRILACFHPSVNTRSRLLFNDHGTQRTFNVRACWDRDQRRRRLEIEATEVLP